MNNTGLVPIKIELYGIGILEGHIIRHIAPLSADAIIDKLPFVLRGRFSFGTKKYWTLPGLEIFKGHNPKSSPIVEKGDIVYNPKTDEFIIILEDFQMPNKVNKIGKVNSNLELLLKARNGLNTKITKKL
ncbi:MAG: cyclophilin-like fold protein [Promethearchaeota archaeon]